MHLILRRLTDQAIMVVLIARPGELVRSAAAAKAENKCKSFGILQIVLSPLSDGESGEVWRDLLGPPGSQRNAAVDRTMVKAAGGFPMVLELLAQDWTANADDSLALTFDWSQRSSATDAPCRRGYKTGVRQADGGAGASTRHALNVASVLGHRLNDFSLYEIGDLGPGQVMSAMSQLIDHRVLRDNGRGLEFVNEVQSRTAAYLEVPSTVRRALQAGVADRAHSGEHARDSLPRPGNRLARGARQPRERCPHLPSPRSPRRHLRRRTGCGEQGLELGIEALLARRTTRRESSCSPKHCRNRGVGQSR